MTERTSLLGIIFSFCAIGMAAIARLVYMPTPQFKTGDTVVKSRFIPADGRMAIAAWRFSKCGSMRVLILMALSTGHIDGFIIPLGMALITLNFLMPTFEWKPTH
jgi:hypothetical protein